MLAAKCKFSLKMEHNTADCGWLVTVFHKQTRRSLGQPVIHSSSGATGKQTADTFSIENNKDRSCTEHRGEHLRESNSSRGKEKETTGGSESKSVTDNSQTNRVVLLTR